MMNNANVNGNANKNNNLKVGDVFAVECYVSFPSKFYPEKMTAKILTTDGDIVYTTAAKIVKTLDILSADPEIDLTQYTFEVVKAGEYNGFPVLALYCDNPLIKKKLMKAFF